MKTATITSRRLALSAFVLLGVVVVLAPVAVADHGHKAGHGHKPKYLSCKPLVSFPDAIQGVIDETGIAPEMVDQPTFERLPIAGGSFFKTVPVTDCGLGWVNDIGNSQAFGNCGGCGQGYWASCAAIGVSQHDFKQTIPHALEGDGGGPCESVFGPGFTVEKYTPPGSGSQGYVVAHVTGANPNGPHPIDYNVYAWTKRKGCFISFDAWPLSLAASEGFVNGAVRSMLKPKSDCSG